MAVSSFFRTVLRRPAPEHLEATPLPPARKDIKECERLSRAQSEAAFLRFLIDDKEDTALSVPQKLVLEIVQDNLNRKEYREKAVPRLPSVIPRLMKSLRDPDSSAKDYVGIVNKDPVMTAAVLKLANSVYFNPTGTYIGDIERAIVKLGISGLRSVLSAAVMQPIIQRQSPYYSQTGRRLWNHSLNCAVACELIAQERGLERFKAYMMGLVHDVGKITLFSELCKQYKVNDEGKPGYKAFAPMLRRKASIMSYLIARDWQLPEEICTALEEQIDIEQGANVSAYAELLFQANIVCEVYQLATTTQKQKMGFLLEEFDLPQDLYTHLAQVSTQV